MSSGQDFTDTETYGFEVWCTPVQLPAEYWQEWEEMCTDLGGSE